MNPIEFRKYVGAGNDFVFIRVQSDSQFIDRQKLASQVCNRHWGIGADGCVFMEQKSAEPSHFKWDFYNSDGSIAEMCGNAARCAVRYCHEVFQQSSCEIQTLCGVVSGEVLETEISVSWSLAKASLEKKEVTLADGSVVCGDFIDTGVPHFVIDDQELSITKNACLEIQEHQKFSPDQTNVTLLSTALDNNRTHTFERGVRDFTLACGTGVIACGFVLREHTSQQQPYSLLTPGGPLKVAINQNCVTLLGPAALVFKGTLSMEGLVL